VWGGCFGLYGWSACCSMSWRHGVHVVSSWFFFQVFGTFVRFHPLCFAFLRFFWLFLLERSFTVYLPILVTTSVRGV